MSSTAKKLPLLVVLVCLLLLVSTTAHAFRCGNRIVIDGMRETEVIALCGDPASTRHIGYVIRAYLPRGHRQSGILTSSKYRYAAYPQEVMVTELVYNFGPRKLMRILRFEGGILTYIETAGYGYRED